MVSREELTVNPIDATRTDLIQQADRGVQCPEFGLNETLFCATIK